LETHIKGTRGLTNGGRHLAGEDHHLGHHGSRWGGRHVEALDGDQRILQAGVAHAHLALIQRDVDSALLRPPLLPLLCCLNLVLAVKCLLASVQRAACPSVGARQR
jgi:hypothetical protein